jgi:nucleotide-binding universal stress UspA family protein
VTDSRPALLCFDGSEDACRAMGDAGGLLAPRPAIVLTVWQSARHLTALDPMGDAVGRLSGIYAELDAVVLQAARDVVQLGAQLAWEAGFQPRRRAECGSAWQTIVAIGAEEDAAVIVVGARGLSRVAAVLGSVSTRITDHADAAQPARPRRARTPLRPGGPRPAHVRRRPACIAGAAGHVGAAPPRRAADHRPRCGRRARAGGVITPTQTTRRSSWHQ